MVVSNIAVYKNKQQEIKNLNFNVQTNILKLKKSVPTNLHRYFIV